MIRGWGGKQPIFFKGLDCTLHILIAALIAASLQLPSGLMSTAQTTVVDCKTAFRHILVSQQIVCRARRYIGVPYVFGGESEFGFDCPASRR